MSNITPFFKQNWFILSTGSILFIVLVKLIAYAFEHDRTIISIRLDQEQFIKLEEISKKDFRDVNHTLLMLVDDYIKYHENTEVVK